MVVYSLRMEEEAVKESVVCGHHIYKEVLRSVYGQEFSMWKLAVNERAGDGEWHWQTSL